MSKVWRAIASFVGLAVVTVPAGAHPHAWITTRSAVVFDAAGQVVAIDVDWTFDKDYSKYAIEGLDTDGDGKFSPTELQALSDSNISALREYDYFVYARAGKKKLKWAPITSYGMANNDEGRLTMQFTAPLVTPVDPRRVDFSYKIYDPTFYIDIEYPKKDPLHAVGPTPRGCHLALLPSPSDEQTNATKAMLAAKPLNWQPDPGEDFGGMFAQPVRVICKKGNS